MAEQRYAVEQKRLPHEVLHVLLLHHLPLRQQLALVLRVLDLRQHLPVVVDRRLLVPTPHLPFPPLLLLVLGDGDLDGLLLVGSGVFGVGGEAEGFEGFVFHSFVFALSVDFTGLRRAYLISMSLVMAD